MLVTTREPLTVDLLTVAPLVVLTVASALGVGFVFASLALVYKRIENVFSLLTIALLFLVAAPVDQYPVLAALPLSQGTDLLTTAMSQGTPLWALPPVELAILAGTAVGYLGLGVLVFRFAERRSRRDGLLGQY
jgi:ABC-2 type transport system permease protein